MSRPSFVRTWDDGAVRHVQLDRPDRRNAVSDELYADLEPLLQLAANDDRIRVVVLSGAGPSFCAGADLKAHASRDRTPAERRAYVWAGQRVCRLLRTMPHPVVVAVQGHAIGAGAEMALSGDVILCATDASFAFPEVGLGTFVGGGVSHELPRLLGRVRAAHLLLTGARVTGEQAAAWGMVTQAVPPGELDERVAATAAALAEAPVRSVRLAKQALARSASSSLDDALLAEAEGLLACMGTDDWAAGIEGFAGRDGGG